MRACDRVALAGQGQKGMVISQHLGVLVDEAHLHELRVEHVRQVAGFVSRYVTNPSAPVREKGASLRESPWSLDRGDSSKRQDAALSGVGRLLWLGSRRKI